MFTLLAIPSEIRKEILAYCYRSALYVSKFLQKEAKSVIASPENVDKLNVGCDDLYKQLIRRKYLISEDSMESRILINIIGIIYRRDLSILPTFLTSAKSRMIITEVDIILICSALGKSKLSMSQQGSELEFLSYKEMREIVKLTSAHVSIATSKYSRVYATTSYIDINFLRMLKASKSFKNCLRNPILIRVIDEWYSYGTQRAANLFCSFEIKPKVIQKIVDKYPVGQYKGRFQGYLSNDSVLQHYNSIMNHHTMFSNPRTIIEAVSRFPSMNHRGVWELIGFFGVEYLPHLLSILIPVCVPTTLSSLLCNMEYRQLRITIDCILQMRPDIVREQLNSILKETRVARLLLLSKFSEPVLKDVTLPQILVMCGKVKKTPHASKDLAQLLRIRKEIIPENLLDIVATKYPKLLLCFLGEFPEMKVSKVVVNIILHTNPELVEQIPEDRII